MQENSQLRESLCWSHTPKGAVWLINNHCPALPRRWSPQEPEKSLLQGTKIQRGVQPLGESQSQDEKPGPAHCPPPPQRWGDSSCTGGLAAATGQRPPSSQGNSLTCRHHQVALPLEGTMWGINGLSAPGQVEPWPATPHCVVPACTVGWTRTPLTWFSASRDFLLPRGPNAAWAGAHPTAGEKPQVAPALLQGSKGSEGKKQGLFHTPCLVPGKLLDLQDHLQSPGSKIQ